MSDFPSDRRSLIRPENSDLRDTSSAIAFAPPAGPHQRHGFHRMSSQGNVEFSDVPIQNRSPNAATHSNSEIRAPGESTEHQGLGIVGKGGTPIARVPVGSRASISPPTPSRKFSTPPTTGGSLVSPGTPGSARPLLASPWTRHGSGTYSYKSVGWEGEGADRRESESDLGRHRRALSGESLDASFAESGEGSAGGRSVNAVGERTKLLEGCPAKHDIHSSRASWLSVSILTLSVYSTIFSGIWLVLAITQPRYGRKIHSGGAIRPATASILFAFFAKTIELSFVTVFVSFLGQVLSRRSLVKASRGITIAELTMRNWVIQPGSLLTHFQHLQHASLTILGAIALTASVVAMFYTTASDALVSPHLKHGKWENKLLYGLVRASYANPEFVKNNCQTPISKEVDREYAGSTCLALEHAGQSYHNTLIYLDTWAKIGAAGEGISTNVAERPQATGMLFDNTTVTGSWIAKDTSNVTAAYEEYKRVVNNVTMAMPHAGVFAAARDGKNGILQPEQLEGLGEYSVRASVVSPAVNVLCINVNSTELAPLVYVTWPNARTVNSTIIGQRMAAADYESDIQLRPGKKFLNSTVVDDIFHWGAAYADELRQPPVFPMLPIDFNTITNISVPYSDSIYLLLKSSATTDYTLCQLRSFLYPFCSTQYNVSGTTGGHLESHCENPSNQIAYAKSVLDHPITYSKDWRNVGSEWITSLSLNTGVSNANASTGRLLSQLVPVYPNWGQMRLSSLMPSVAETLAVMAGSTLLLSTASSTYYHYWNYTSTKLDPGVYLPFNASLSSQQYTSGATQRWQAAVFYPVLALVFITNAFCLGYFVVRAGLVTDYTETQNLFALAVNSPQSRRLEGSCGAGPEGSQLSVDWHVVREDESGHFSIREGVGSDDIAGGKYDGGGWGLGGLGLRRRRKRNQEGFRARREVKSMSSYDLLSSQRRSWL